MVGEGEAAEFVRKGIPAGTEKTTSPKEKMLEESFRKNNISFIFQYKNGDGAEAHE